MSIKQRNKGNITKPCFLTLIRITMVLLSSAILVRYMEVYPKSRCIAGIKEVMVIPLTIPKLKLSCLIIIHTPPWHASTCHTNLCKAPPTEPTEPGDHFVYWKSTSSPGSHPTENRTCRKDLWAAFVLWDVFYFLSFVLFGGLNGVNR